MQRRMAYGLPSPTPYRHPTWNLEVSPMHPAPRPTEDSNTTPSPSFPHSWFRLWFEKKVKKDSLPLVCASGLPNTIYQKKLYFKTLPPVFLPHTHTHACNEGSAGVLKSSLVLWFAMEGLGTSTQTVFSFRFFSWILFFNGSWSFGPVPPHPRLRGATRSQPEPIRIVEENCRNFLLFFVCSDSVIFLIFFFGGFPTFFPNFHQILQNHRFCHPHIRHFYL